MLRRNHIWTAIAITSSLLSACGSSGDQAGLDTAPIATEPVVTDPVITTPVSTDPVVADPVVTEPVASTREFDFQFEIGYSFHISIDNVAIEENIADASIGKKFLLIDIDYTITNTTPGGKNLQVGDPLVFVGIPLSIGALEPSVDGIGRGLSNPAYTTNYSFVATHYIRAVEGSGSGDPLDARRHGGTNNYVKAPEDLDLSNLIFMVQAGSGLEGCFMLSGGAVPSELPCSPSAGSQAEPPGEDAVAPAEPNELDPLVPGDVYELIEPAHLTSPPGLSSTVTCGDTTFPESVSFFGTDGYLAVVYGSNEEATAGLDALTEVVRRAGSTPQPCTDSLGGTWQISSPAVASTGTSGRIALTYSIVNPDGSKLDIAEEYEICRNVQISGRSAQIDAPLQRLGC